MKIANFIVFIILHKISLYQFDIVKKSKKILELGNKYPPQIRTKEFSESSDLRIFFPSEFTTQIAIFSQAEIGSVGKKNLTIEQKTASNQLLEQLKSAQISLELRLVSLFVYRLNNLTYLQQELAQTASHQPNRIISISSSFTMSKEQKLKILKIIGEKLSTDVQVEFKTMIGSNIGIELCDHGYRIFSNIDTCITEIESKTENQPVTETTEYKQLIKA